MRVLLSNYDMNYLGGTQVWIHEMWSQLSRSHEVDLFHSCGNSLWPHIPNYDASKDYDLALINHWPTFRSLRRSRVGIRLYTSHGVTSRLEYPPLGADAYVSVSRAVEARFPFHSTVIPNPIDTERYRSLRPVNTELKRVAFVSNRQGRARPIIEEACRLLGVELKVVGGDARVRDVVEVYNWADLVVGVARTALEAMASERNVICFDWIGGAGMATPKNIEQLAESNFGGHLHPRQATWYSPGQLADLMGGYDPKMSLRPYVQAAHHPSIVASRYMALADAVGRHGPLARIRRRVFLLGPRQLTSVEVTRAIMDVRGCVRGPKKLVKTGLRSPSAPSAGARSESRNASFQRSRLG